MNSNKFRRKYSFKHEDFTETFITKTKHYSVNVYMKLKNKKKLCEKCLRMCLFFKNLLFFLNIIFTIFLLLQISHLSNILKMISYSKLIIEKKGTGEYKKSFKYQFMSMSLNDPSKISYFSTCYHIIYKFCLTST